MKLKVGMISLSLAVISIALVVIYGVSHASPVDEALKLLFRDNRTPETQLYVRAVAFDGRWNFEIKTSRDYNQKSGLASDRALTISKSDLVLPVGYTVEINLLSNDWIYPFIIPEFGIAADAIPGRIQSLFLLPKEVGTYQSICNEDCKPEWDEIGFTVQVVDENVFNCWLANKDLENK